MIKKLSLFALVLTAAVACSSDDSESDAEPSDVTVTVYGEEFVEEGIPAEEVADGWAITFESFSVELRDITVANQSADGPFDLEISGLTDGAGYVVATVEAAPGTFTDAGYTISSVRASGTAEFEGTTKTFDWDFGEIDTQYTACETSTEVTSEGGAFEITIHADHFFYESLVSSDPELRFQTLADADADEDGVITKAELEAADIGALDPGNESVDNLWEWLLAQTATLGHVDGEGHCDAARL